MALPAIELTNEKLDEVSFFQETAAVELEKIRSIANDIKEIVYQTYTLQIDQLELNKSQLFAQKEALDEQRRAARERLPYVQRVPSESTIPSGGNGNDGDNGFFGLGGFGGAAGGGILGGLLGAGGLAAAKKALTSVRTVGGRIFKGGFPALIGYAVGSTAVDIAAALVDDPELKETIKREGQQAVNYASLGAAVGFMLFGPPGAVLGGLLGIAVSLFDDLEEWIKENGSAKIDAFKKKQNKNSLSAEEKVAEQSIGPGTNVKIKDIEDSPYNGITGKIIENYETKSGKKRSIIQPDNGGEPIDVPFDTLIPQATNKRATEKRKENRPSWSPMSSEDGNDIDFSGRAEARGNRAQKAPSTPPVQRVTASEMQLTVANQLKENGFNDTEIRKILGQIYSESGFVPKNENIAGYSAETIRHFSKIITSVPELSIEEARELKEKGPKAVGNFLYGGRMGNAEDEGFLYRGRGLIQLTGKDNYEAVGKRIGVDLVNDPDLANDPKIASMIVSDFFKQKKREGHDLSTVKGATEAVGPAKKDDPKELERRSDNTKRFENFVDVLNNPQPSQTASAPVVVKGGDTVNNVSQGSNKENTNIVAAAQDLAQRVKNVQNMTGIM